MAKTQMGATSGKWGVVHIDGTPFTTCGNWMVNNLADTKPFVASNTKGGTGRRLGWVDWNGKLEQYTGKPGVMPGEIFNFIGYIGPRAGTPGAVGPTVSGIAICDNIAMTINWETGDIISTVTTFSGAGELISDQADSTLADTTAPDAPSSLYAKVVLAAYTSGTLTYENVCAKNAVLTITAANLEIRDSCNAPFVSRAGGNIDWTLALLLDEADPSTLPLQMTPNNYVAVQIFTDIVNFWDLKWGLVKDYNNFLVERNTGKIIDYTVDIEMSVDAGSLVGFSGAIILPGETIPWFPVVGA